MIEPVNEIDKMTMAIAPTLGTFHPESGDVYFTCENLCVFANNLVNCFMEHNEMGEYSVATVENLKRQVKMLATIVMDEYPESDDRYALALSLKTAME